MNKLYTTRFPKFFFLFWGLFASFVANAQVTVAGSTRANGTYLTLSAAFAAINSNTNQNGNNITIAITANTTEPVGGAILNQAIQPWATLTISPSGGAARTISGAATAGIPLINLDGADNVTIDGLNTGGNSLTITNTTPSATAGTSTIRFINGANNNTITRCTVLGSHNAAAGITASTFGGTIFFSTDVSSNGNNGNTISFCNIGPAGSNLPTKGIMSSLSTSASNGYFNRNNSVLNCNIYDFFSATASSSGIILNDGNSAWTISNNKFYQTATRTQTTASDHTAIRILNNNVANGGSGFTIHNNTIGYSASDGTGTYTVAGLANTRFFPIRLNLNTNADSAATNITNNLISNIAMSGAINGTVGTSCFVGINCSNGTVNINNNTIGSTTSSTAINISSSATTTATATIDLYGIFYSGTLNFTANNNIISGIQFLSPANNGGRSIYGIRFSGGASTISTINNNQIGSSAIANSIYANSTFTTSAMTVIGIMGTNSQITATGNVITSLTSSSGTGLGTTLASPHALNGMLFSPANQHLIENNTISNLTFNNIGSIASRICGIHFLNNGGSLVNRNFIHSFNNQSTSTSAEVYGIRITIGSATYANNMIRLGINNAGASLQAGNIFYNGMVEQAGQNNFYHNSIFIGGTVSSGSNPSCAFRSLAVINTTNTRTIYNNIFFNARSGPGAHYAISLTGTTTNPLGLDADRNLLFANGTNGHVGLYNAIDRTSLADWKAAIEQDVNSISANPNFVAPIGPGSGVGAVDLHVQSPTPIEGAGIAISSITVDFDNQARNSFTPTDIGADAGNFTSIDISAPAFVYSKIEHTCGTGNVSITGVQITDATGVPTTGANRPRIYYNRNNGTWFSQPGTLSSGTATNGIWNFVINSSDMVGLTPGDVVRYYIIAQDLAGTPNITSYPSFGLVASNVNSVTTPPTLAAPTTPPAASVLGSYTILWNFNGTYTIGASGTFPTINSAVNAYNLGCISGPTVFSLIDAAYSTSTIIEILENSGASATNTLTIKPTLANTVITSTMSGSSAVFRLRGADYIIIDGSTGSVSNTLCPISSATRNLTITHNAGNATSAIISINDFIAAGPINNSATNNIIRNCILTSSTTTLGYGIHIGGGANIDMNVSSRGVENNNNQVINNDVRNVGIGIFQQGSNLPLPQDVGIIIRNNILTMGIRRVGIATGNSDGTIIEGNKIEVSNTSASEDCWGISVGFGNANSYGFPAFLRTNNSNIIIRNNEISSVTATGTGSTIGIGVASSLSGINLLANNLISNIRTIGILGNTDIVAGIVLDPANITGQTPDAVFNVHFNTVHLTGTASSTTAGTSGMISAAFRLTAVPVSGNAYTFNLRNNILSNRQNMNTNGVRRSAAISSLYTVFANQSYNYNVYDVTSPDIDFSVGLQDPFTQHTLASWRTTFGGDVNSVQHAPVFLATNNPRVDGANSANDVINNIGTPIVAITNDIDCASRSATPDPGAAEFGPLSWTGVVSSAWENGANWSSGVPPGIGANVFIPAALPPGAQANPTIASEPTVNNITIESPRILTINNGFGLRVNGVLTSNGQVRVNSGGSLVQGATSTIAGSGDYIVRRQGNNTQFYNFWSSPIQSANINVLGGNKYYFDPAFSTYTTADDANDPGWRVATGTMILGTGYASTGAGLVSFTGTINNYPDATPLATTVYSVADGADLIKMNLIGNPFPSAIDVGTFLTENSASIEDGIYFWNQQTAPPFTTSDYTIVNLVGGIGVYGAGPNDQPDYTSIPSCQGFLVLRLGATAGSSTVNFRNSQRKISGNQHFYNTDGISKLWLSVTSPQMKYNETLIAFKEGATDGVDNLLDSKKLSGNNFAIALHSFIEDNKYAIQTLPLLHQQKSIELGLLSNELGSFIISIKQMEQFETGTMIVLEDTKLNVFHNLTLIGDYTYVREQSDSEKRFKLHFYAPPKLTSVAACALNTGKIAIENSSVISWNTRLENLEGNLIAESVLVGNGYTEFQNLNVGTYKLIFTNDASGFSFETFEDVIQQNTADATFIFTSNVQDLAPFESIFAEVTNPIADAVYSWSLNNLQVGVGNAVSFAVSESGTYELSLKATLGSCESVFVDNFVIHASTSITQNSRDTKFNLFPNPASTGVTVIWNGDDKYDILKITDLSGRTVLISNIASKIYDNQIQLDINELSNGVYILTLEGEKSIQFIKFNKIHSK